MRITDLLFLVSALFALFLLGRLAYLALRGRWSGVRTTAGVAGLYAACYAGVLVTVSLATPRRVFAPGERRCFDDWCIAAGAVRPAKTPLCAQRSDGAVWIATVQVSSDAKRVRQRARDAALELEDQNGTRYQPCSAPSTPLSDELGPGESFVVRMPFVLPRGRLPAGMIVSHGAFPGIVIIGDDQSLFHRRALHRTEWTFRNY